MTVLSGLDNPDVFNQVGNSINASISTSAFQLQVNNDNFNNVKYVHHSQSKCKDHFTAK